MQKYRAYTDQQAAVLAALQGRAMAETHGDDGLRELFAPLSRDDVYALLWIIDQMHAFVSNEFDVRPEE